MSRPKTNCPGVDFNVVWYVERTAHATALSIPDHGSDSSISWFCISKVRIILPMVWCILSRIAFDCGFLFDEGLASISYSSFINCWNSLPINSEPWSYVIFVGHGYLDSHAISTLFATTSEVAVSDCIISNQLVAGSIMVIAWRRSVFFPLRRIW